VLGVGPSGLKKIKRRLYEKGLLRCIAGGYEVLVPGLASASAGGGGYLVPRTTIEKKEEKVAPRSAADIMASLHEIYDLLYHNPDSEELGYFPARMFDFFASSLTQLIDEGAAVLPADLVARVTRDRNDMAARAHAAGHAKSQTEYHRYSALISAATPDQLADVFAGIVRTRQLESGEALSAPKLLEML
jgi:hypothetical protein